MRQGDRRQTGRQRVRQAEIDLHHVVWQVLEDTIKPFPPTVKPHCCSWWHRGSNRWDRQSVRQCDSETDSQWDSETVRQTVSQTVWQWDRQAVRQWDRQAVRQWDSETDRQSDSVTVRQTGSQTVWQWDRHADRQWDNLTDSQSDSVTADSERESHGEIESTHTLVALLGQSWRILASSSHALGDIGLATCETDSKTDSQTVRHCDSDPNCCSWRHRCSNIRTVWILLPFGFYCWKRTLHCFTASDICEVFFSRYVPTD